MPRFTYGGTVWDFSATIAEEDLNADNPPLLWNNTGGVYRLFYDRAATAEVTAFYLWNPGTSSYSTQVSTVSTNADGFLPDFQVELAERADLYNESGYAMPPREGGASESTGGASSWDELSDKPTEFPPSDHSHAVTDVFPDVLAQGDLYVGSGVGQMVRFPTNGIPGNTIIQDPETESGLRWGTPVAPLVTLANMPGGTSFNIYWDTTQATWLFRDQPISARPTDRSELHMVAYGGSASPTFMLKHDVWFEETP